MDEESKTILKIIGFEFDELKDVDGLIIPRETLLSDTIYDKIKIKIPELKKIYSSSFMTSLQKNADKAQKWPLLNLVRQILNVYHYKMDPIRKANGYTLEGIKKYRRFFQIKKKFVAEENDTCHDITNNDDDVEKTTKTIIFDDVLEDNEEMS
jgi:hypothetical protein